LFLAPAVNIDEEFIKNNLKTNIAEFIKEQFEQALK
jgi:hypothetical protein